MTAETVVATFTVVIGIATVINLAMFAVTHGQILQLQKRLNWFTGCMESHSAMMVRLQAKRDGVPVVWWDPKEEGWPKTGPHGQSADLDLIRLGLHPKDRAEIPEAWR